MLVRVLENTQQISGLVLESLKRLSVLLSPDPVHAGLAGQPRPPRPRAGASVGAGPPPCQPGLVHEDVHHDLDVNWGILYEDPVRTKVVIKKC